MRFLAHRAAAARYVRRTGNTSGDRNLEEIKGQWKVADANILRRTPLLNDFFNANPRNIVVVTDFCCMECYKGDELNAIQKSLAIISQYPRQVVVLKGTQQIATLTGQTVLRREDFVDWDQTREFTQFCLLVARAVTGNAGLLSQLQAHRAEARAYLAKVAYESGGVVEGIKQITRELPTDMVRRLRSNSALIDDDIKRVMTGVVLLARELLSVAPHFSGPTLEKHASRSFVFRFALAGYLLAINWVASGGIESAAPTLLGNDVVDMNYVAYATFFDGVISNDNKLNEMYRDARLFLDTVFVDESV